MQNNNPPGENEKEKFIYTPEGFLRHRIGRGGRMIIDRRSINPTAESLPSPDYYQININGRVCLKKLKFFDPDNNKDVTSSFRLSSIVKGSVDANNNNNNNDEHLTHQICYKMN